MITPQLQAEFQQNLDPRRIKTHRFKYTTKVSNTDHWALEINSEGLFYTDISGAYSVKKNEVTRQSFSDFWFYGPLLPMPELATRQTVLAILSGAFLDTKVDTYSAHFQLFEYPKFIDAPSWEFGTSVMSDFVNMRDYGVDFGSQNFHDGLVYLAFVSFEYCLYHQESAKRYIIDQVMGEIQKTILKNCFNDSSIPVPRLADIPLPERSDTVQPEPEAPPAPPTAVDKQATAETLWKTDKNEKGVEMLLELLHENDPEHYWRNYVFNRLFDMRDSPAARSWVLQCLQGSDEVYYKKAVDVLFMWGMYGDQVLTDKELLKSLNWSDKENDTVEFQSAMQVVIRLLG